jgi:ATP-binding cassette subfamily B (MDR/TAP) protein 1
MHGYTGAHDELLMNLDGAYSQLIQIQESPKEAEQKLDRHISDKSRSLTSSELIGINSAGNSSRHSFTLPFGLPSSIVELYEGNDTNDNEKDKAGDSEVPKQSPLGRLANLNKPELPVILLGSLAAAIHGMILPVSGVIISNAIITFFEPADKLKNDSQFWGLICIVLGIVSIISIPVEYFLFGIAGGKLIERVRASSFQSIVHQDVAWFDNPKNSRLVSIPLFIIFFCFHRTYDYEGLDMGTDGQLHLTVEH